MLLARPGPPRYLMPVIPCPRRRMPPTKRWSSADFDAVIAQVTPDVLALLSDGVPRSRAAIIAALAGRHLKDDVRRTLMRLAITERLVEKRGRYTLPALGSEPG
jgi:hypothetical protein